MDSSELHSTLAALLRDRYSANAARIRELAVPLSDEQFWRKPFAFGNSFGHLVLHLTGNLNYYVGTQIASTGYVRDRLREFTESNPPSKEETLRGLDEAVALVVKTIGGQKPDQWAMSYSAVGTKAPNRLSIFLVCDSHMLLHIGQMIYLTYELGKQGN